MGLFLTIAGVAGVTPQRLCEKLEIFASESGIEMQPAHATPGDDNILVIHSTGITHTILWAWKGPDDVEGLCKYLSRELSTPSIWLHIHDGDFWMYQLFANGIIVDAFNPMPRYWNENAPDEEIRRWRGNADVVAKHWPNVSAESIARYLIAWDFDVEQPGRAYPSDAHPDLSEWQLLDFMSKLNLEYPIEGSGGSIRGVLQPAVRQDSAEAALAKGVKFKGATFLFK